MSRHRALLRAEDFDDGYDDDDYYDDEEEDDDYPRHRPQPQKPQPQPQQKQQKAPAQQTPVVAAAAGKKKKKKKSKKPAAAAEVSGPKLADDVAALRLVDDTEAEALKERQRREREAMEMVVVPATSPAPSMPDDGGGGGERTPMPPLSPARTPEPGSARRDAAFSQHSATRHAELLRMAAAQRTKPTLSIVVIGHVDAGKSTTIGHLLHKLGRVSAQQLHKLQRESESVGKGSFAFAWVLDEHAEERARGVTVDVAVTHFETPRLRITLLDAPGHRDFVPAMISGAAQAEAAVLVVSAVAGEFEAGFDRSGQTKEHVALARSLGVQQLIVAVNQMDRAGWSAARFEEVSGKVLAFVRRAGFRDPSSVTVLPISGLTGENLVERSDPALTSWYTEGPTLVEAIDKLVPPERGLDQHMRLCIGDVYKDRQAGLCVGGKIETGIIAIGDRVTLMPANEACTVRSMARNQERVEFACAGDNVDVVLQGLEPASLSVGSVLCDPASPIALVGKLRANIITYSLDVPLLPGQQCVLYAHNANAPAAVQQLHATLDPKTGAVLRSKPRSVGEGVTADVTVVLGHGICLETHAALRALGRFTLRYGGRTIAAGIVTQTWPPPKRKAGRKGDANDRSAAAPAAATTPAASASASAAPSPATK